jgi:hypothetical protein
MLKTLVKKNIIKGKSAYFLLRSNLLSKPEEYDFVDFGSKVGHSMNFAMKKLGGKRGLGIEIKPEMVKEAKKNGHEVILGDITNLELPDDFVRFTVISHLLEHLSDLEMVKKTLQTAARISREFIYIRGPIFDNDEYLETLGLRVFWSNWPGGHTCHLTTGQLSTILESIGVRGYKIDFEVEINDSNSPNIHSLSSSPNQTEYDPEKHPPKPFVKFDRKLYREFVCIVNL